MYTFTKHSIQQRIPERIYYFFLKNIKQLKCYKWNIDNIKKSAY